MADEKWCYTREVARKGVHLLSTFFIIIYLAAAYFFGHRAGLLALAFLLVILIECEYVRIELRKKIPLISKLWWVKRAKERQKLGGEIYFLIGSIICLAVFEPWIAITAVFMTTFGDLAAALIGKRFGRHWIPKLKCRAWEGVLAEFAVDIITGFAIVKLLSMGFFAWLGGSGFGPYTWIIIVSMAAVATAVETIIAKLDDNLLIPVFSGFAGQIIFMILSYFL